MLRARKRDSKARWRMLVACLRNGMLLKKALLNDGSGRPEEDAPDGEDALDDEDSLDPDENPGFTPSEGHDVEETPGFEPTEGHDAEQDSPGFKPRGMTSKKPLGLLLQRDTMSKKTHRGSNRPRGTKSDRRLGSPQREMPRQRRRLHNAHRPATRQSFHGRHLPRNGSQGPRTDPFR